MFYFFYFHHALFFFIYLKILYIAVPFNCHLLLMVDCHCDLTWRCRQVWLYLQLFILKTRYGWAVYPFSPCFFCSSASVSAFASPTAWVLPACDCWSGYWLVSGRTQTVAYCSHNWCSCGGQGHTGTTKLVAKCIFNSLPFWKTQFVCMIIYHFPHLLYPFNFGIYLSCQSVSLSVSLLVCFSFSFNLSFSVSLIYSLSPLSETPLSTKSSLFFSSLFLSPLLCVSSLFLLSHNFLALSLLLLSFCLLPLSLYCLSYTYFISRFIIRGWFGYKYQ